MQQTAMNNRKTSSQTLLLSIMVSASGLFVIGLGLMAGRSSTQIVDFIRRSLELWAVVLAFVTYRLTTKAGGTDTKKREKLERTSNLLIGILMCFGSMVMLILSFASSNTDKGNVVPGLCITIVAASANIAFWWRYSHLNKIVPNQTLAVQARLYRAKSLVDICVTLVLLSVVIAPGSLFSYYFDLIGSIVVAFYLFFCGAQTILERLNR